MKFNFADFVGKFPPVSMPVTLGEDTHHTFSTENEPLPEAMIAQFIHPTDPDAPVDDEFTEYIACFSLEDAAPFIALVWWKATLLNYEYVLATFTEKGQLIQRRVIAHTRVLDNGKVDRAVATINEEFEIYIAEGSSSDGETFDPGSSKSYQIEILPNGMID
jgi:hypothetical protein